VKNQTLPHRHLITPGPEICPKSGWTGGAGSTTLRACLMQRARRKPRLNHRICPSRMRSNGSKTIVESMEAQDLPLETLLARYEEGARLTALCQSKLNEAELKNSTSWRKMPKAGLVPQTAGNRRGNRMNRYLDMVDHPSHVKKLTPEQLGQLAGEIRHELITKLAKNGGHLGPNLGVVELTLALHRVFSTPNDKFVWDVSHQSYVHKLLTGRKNRFETIRTTDGLNGFALRTESEHDCYGAGHAGNGALGGAGHVRGAGPARIERECRLYFRRCGFDQRHFLRGPQQHRPYHAALYRNLNDNEWSIAKNVGAIPAISTSSSPIRVTIIPTRYRASGQTHPQRLAGHQTGP